MKAVNLSKLVIGALILMFLIQMHLSSVERKRVVSNEKVKSVAQSVHSQVYNEVPLAPDNFYQQEVEGIENSNSFPKDNNKCKWCRDEKDFERISMNKIPVKNILIYTNKRSGSSFMGELFNRNNEAFYMFEPLFPYTRYCDKLANERLETLKKVMQCKLHDITEDYMHAFDITKHVVKDCLRCNICLYDRHTPIARKYHEYIFKDRDIKPHFVPLYNCKFPLDMEIVSNICSNATVIVDKILRVCRLHTLERVFQRMFYEDPNLHGKIGIIHLIRDPRAIISSRLLLVDDEARRTNLSVTADDLCSRLRSNMEYANFVWEHEDGVSKLDGVRHFRIRHEDVTSFPLVAGKAIYRYFGLNIPLQVRLWIDKSTNQMEAGYSPFSTVRDKNKVLNGWRSKLKIDQVQIIQNYCQEVMDMMGYKTVNSQDELEDLSTKLW